MSSLGAFAPRTEHYFLVALFCRALSYTSQRWKLPSLHAFEDCFQVDGCSQVPSQIGEHSAPKYITKVSFFLASESLEEAYYFLKGQNIIKMFYYQTRAQ